MTRLVDQYLKQERDTLRQRLLRVEKIADFLYDRWVDQRAKK